MLAAFTASGWNVSTEPSMQSALIEEFTGIHCPNCPDGHAMATTLMNLHPRDVYTIAIHAGHYAEPTGRQPNFITSVGEAIHDHFKVSSYPSGTVSRQNVGAGLVIGRGQWAASCRTVSTTLSPVNLWTKCTYDEETRLVTLEVEGYLTENMEDPRLNVFMLQNEILGPQSGGQLGNDYPHRHMLRSRLTGDDFGDPIEVKTKGEYFSRTLTYTLPADIKEVEVDPRNVELLTFVTDGKDNVRKVSECRLETPGLEPLFIVSTSAPLLPISKNYGFDFVEMYINNHGGVPVTTADFDITLNGETKTYSWTGEVPAHTNQLVRIPLGGDWKDVVDSKDNQYAIRMTKANGREVETASVRGKFNEIATYPDELTVVIKTDMDAADNTWRILDENGETVKEFGPYENGVVNEYTEQVSLESGKVYCLEVTDSWGDGVCHPLGSLKMFDKGGKQVTQYKEIKDYGMRQFFRADATLGLDTAVSGEAVAVEYYDLAGRKISEPQSGVYVVRATMADGSVHTEKKVIF